MRGRDDDLEEALRQMEERYGLTDDDGPDVVIIRDRVVPTDWDGEGEPPAERVYEQRVYRDEAGEWQTETVVDERGWGDDE